MTENPRSVLAVKREIGKVTKIKPVDAHNRSYKMGVHQALAWVLRDQAASPSACLRIQRRPRKSS